jgi:hypothetical protein
MRALRELPRVDRGTETLVKFYFFTLICASKSAMSKTSESKSLASDTELVKGYRYHNLESFSIFVKTSLKLQLKSLDSITWPETNENLNAIY